MSNELDQKYRKDNLNQKELTQWREKINAMSDESLESIIKETWMQDDIDTSEINDYRIGEMKKNIDSQIKSSKLLKRRTSKRLYFRVTQVAATILLPLFILTTLYLYKENAKLVSDEMLMSTGVGERASVTLPDGTFITLNAESRLKYAPALYNKSERRIDFEGEGFFKVKKDKECPFLIDVEGLQVKVLGTSFNLLARKNANTAELALETGSVLFSSVLTGKEVLLKPNDLAVLNRQTGNITVVSQTHINDFSAWSGGELVFRNVPLESVIASVADAYSVNVEFDEKLPIQDLFTGTLSTTNINEVLEILEKTYHIKAILKGENIFLISGN